MNTFVAALLDPQHSAPSMVSETASAVVDQLDEATFVLADDSASCHANFSRDRNGNHRGNAGLEEAPALLARLVEKQKSHPFWSNRLFKACVAGHLTQDDFHLVFSQYYLYSRNFTRYLSGVMANLEDDLLRTRLSENLWEEGGGAEPEKRHAEIFRGFLRGGLSIDISAIQFLDCTRLFVREYLDFCKNAEAVAGSAFLSLGTESIVPRMYEIFVKGLLGAGIDEMHLEFFRIHIACDDEHAETLADIVLSYSRLPGWYRICEQAMDHALELRRRFFEALYDHIEQRRVQGILGKIQARRSLAQETSGSLVLRRGERGELLYDNTNERLNIEFGVESVPFSPQVLEPRIVRIPAGKFNENHKHAHETVFYIVEGKGRVVVDGRSIEVQAGDLVFVPRWAMHQSQNLGAEEMVILAVTDFGLTGKAYLGDYLKTARMKPTEKASR